MKIIQTSIIAGLAFFLSAGISYGAELDDIDLTIRVVESDDVNEMHNELSLPHMSSDSEREHENDDERDHEQDGEAEHAQGNEGEHELQNEMNHEMAGEMADEMDARDEREDAIEDSDEGREDRDDVNEERGEVDIDVVHEELHSQDVPD